MPKRFFTCIGDANDTVLLKHLVSSDKELPLKHIEDQIDWNYQEPKSQKPITREQVQSRLTYLRQLQQDDIDTFTEICITKLQPQEWKNLDVKGKEDDSDWEEEDEEKNNKTKKRGVTDEDDPSEGTTAKKRRKASPPAMAASDDSTWNQGAYGLPANTPRIKVQPNPYDNWEVAVFPVHQGIKSDIKGPNNSEVFYSGWFIQLPLDLPHAFHSQGENVILARQLSSTMVLITCPVSSYSVCCLLQKVNQF